MKDIKFLDYTIHMSGDGLVLVDKRGCNAMPGACVFCYKNEVVLVDHILEAKKAALMLFMINRPKDFDASLYWRLEGRGGSYHEWFTLQSVIKKEGLEMPTELEKSVDGINFLIGFNGKKL